MSVKADGGVPQSYVDAAIAAAIASMQQAMPGPSVTTPQSIGVAGAVGTGSGTYARPDHTHASSVQRTVLTSVPGSGVTTVTWNFATPYSVVPVVNATALDPSGTQPYLVDLQSVSKTSVTFRVWQAQSTTLGTTLGALLGLVISPFVPAPAGLSVHCWAALPTQ